MEQCKKKLVINTIYMYILSFAKLIIPLISLPYLTKVLSVECIGGVSFVKSFVSYLQVFVDFGFVISATKDIVGLIKNKGDVNKSIGNTLYAQLLLSIIGLLVMIICVACLNVVSGYELYAILSIVPVILSIFLFEYVFRAYEKMEKITFRYVIMRLIALVLTLIFVKSDENILLMPIFDILASIVAIVLVHVQLRKLGIKVDFSFKRIKDAFIGIRSSFVCFVTNFMSTALTILNTLLIGIVLTKEDVAYWTVAFQFMSAINAMYTPIVSSVYPVMLKEGKLRIIHQIMLIFMPIIIFGSVAVYFLSDWFVTLIFGQEYIFSGTIIRFIIPVIIASFPASIYGWPCFSVIGKEKTNMLIIVVASIIQVCGIVVVSILGNFNLINLAIIRGVAELVVASLRMCVVYRNKSLFQNKKLDIENESIEIKDAC